MITDQLLGLLKVVLLLALYGFFARVLWAVWNEIRVPAVSRVAVAVADRPETNVASDRRVARRHRVSALRIVAPADMKGVLVDIGENDIVIGRDDACEVRLAADTGASARHARIRRVDGHVTIEDLGSTNHTMVNGKEISAPTRLRVGDRIHIGLVTFEVEK